MLGTTLAEKFFKENPDYNWDTAVNNEARSINYESDEYDTELMLGKLKLKIKYFDMYNGDWEISIIFEDGSGIDLYQPEYQTAYVEAVWTNINDASTRKEVHYVKRQDIIVYTD